MPRLVSEVDFEKEVLQSNVPVVVDFFATWCAPCKMIAPILEDLQSDFGDAVNIVKMDVDQAKSIAKTYAVRGVPTIMIFDGGDVVDKFTGVLPKADLAEKITPWL